MIFPSFTHTMSIALLLAGGAGTAFAQSNSDTITVGSAGLPGNCTTPTIQAAINEARRRWDAGLGRQEIRITRDIPGTVWLNQNVTVTDMDVTLKGGYDNCTTDVQSGHTYVSGKGGSREPVFSIRGTAIVDIDHVFILEGDADGGEGGGIDYLGQGALLLEWTSVDLNKSEEGAGIRVEPRGGPVELRLEADVSVSGNIASRIGGGIYTLAPNGHYVVMKTGPNVRITDNEALNGNGGGLLVRHRGYLDLHGPGSELWNNRTNADGGGLEFDARGEISLRDFQIHANRAEYGGGMHVVGDGGSAILTVGDNVQVFNNQATQNGGGLHIGGGARLTMLGDGSGIIDNQAGQRGGGLYVKAPARADIGAGAGAPGLPVFQYNRARRGGAIAANGNDGSTDAQVNLYTGRTGQPMTLAENSASERGGALYSIGQINGSSARICVHDTSFVANRAAQGAAAFVDTDNDVDWTEVGSTSSLAINATSGPCARPASAVACTDPTLCNRIALNRSLDTNDVRTDGAIIETSDYADIGFCFPACGFPGSPGSHQVDRITMEGNIGGALVRGRMHVGLNTMVAVDNTTSDALFRGNVSVRHTSAAGNRGSAFAVDLSDGSVSSSLFLLPAGQRFGNAMPSKVTATHVFSNSVEGLPPHHTNFLVLDPGFVDAQAPGFDLHLRPDAHAIDTAPETGAGEVDLDGKPRTIDAPGRVDQGGPTDRGAYERNYWEIFSGRFE